MNFKISVPRSRPNAFKTSSEYAYNFPKSKIDFIVDMILIYYIVSEMEYFND